MRGEDPVHRIVEVDEHGSPPHARGRPIFFRVFTPAVGITPACAGKTADELVVENRVGDHPRMRGEDRFSTYRSVEPGRITPACAGKTSCCSTA